MLRWLLTVYVSVGVGFIFSMRYRSFLDNLIGGLLWPIIVLGLRASEKAKDRAYGVELPNRSWPATPDQEQTADKESDDKDDAA